MHNSFSSNLPELNSVVPFHIEVNGHYAQHAHSEHELVVVQRGRLVARVPNGEHIAGPGDILLYPAGVLHEEWAMDGEPVLTWALRFHSSDWGMSNVFFGHDAHGLVQELMVKLTWEFQIAFSPETADRQSCGRQLQLLLTEVKRLAAQGSQARVDWVRAYICAHIHEPLTLKQLASVSGLSKSHFARQYRMVTGRTPMQDARFLRVQEARRLIMTTSQPLHEIAPRVGIANEHHLSRLLKSILGVTARDLRKGA